MFKINLLFLERKKEKIVFLIFLLFLYENVILFDVYNNFK